MDDILKKAISRELLKKPSIGFTDKVMKDIFILKEIKPYQPLISKKVWVFLLVLFVAFFIVIFLRQSEANIEISTLSFIDDFSHQMELFDFKVTELFSRVNFLIISAISFVIFLLLTFDIYLFKKEHFRSSRNH